MASCCSSAPPLADDSTLLEGGVRNCRLGTTKFRVWKNQEVTMSYDNAAKLLRLAICAAGRVGMTLGEIEEMFECDRRTA